MCNASNCSHDELNDDLDGFFSDFNIDPTQKRDMSAFPDIAKVVEIKPAFVEPCRACRGSGNFVSYTGRIVGQCFKCKGTGKASFKTAPEARAKAKASADAAKERSALASVEAYKAANPDEFEWMIAKCGSFDFAMEMLRSLTKYGSLTERQQATVTRLTFQDKERTAARVVAVENAPLVDITPIMKAMQVALDRGVARPKLRLDEFKFAYSNGVIYVRHHKDNETYYGKIADGKFIKVRSCSAEDEARIVKVAADPEAAATAYGQRFGACSICGRQLTKGESIDRAMGPICMSKWGW